jgi:hypothetical protein
VEFFQDHLLPVDQELVRRYLGVCHDTCHASVMFESQADVIARYRDAGIGVGKVQVSSAVRAPFADMESNEVAMAVQQLSEFAEDRYLHQTVRQNVKTGETTFHEDLPSLIGDGAVQDAWRDEEWRVHFHVPVYLESFGLLQTTQEDTLECLSLLAADESVLHYEVETYAWGVLPKSLQLPDLSEGIAKELKWMVSNS